MSLGRRVWANCRFRFKGVYRVWIYFGNCEASGIGCRDEFRVCGQFHPEGLGMPFCGILQEHNKTKHTV